MDMGLSPALPPPGLARRLSVGNEWMCSHGSWRGTLPDGSGLLSVHESWGTSFSVQPDVASSKLSLRRP
jgi:hypothetical protein